MNIQLINEPIKNFTTIEQILYNRGITDKKDMYNYLNTTDADINKPELFGIDKLEEAVKALAWTLINEEEILVIVDADCDGFTSAACLINFCYHYFPSGTSNHLHWFLHDGKQHGLHDCIDTAMQYDLIICPDSASNDIEEHQRLREAGKTVIVLDHHDIEGDLSQDALSEVQTMMIAFLSDVNEEHILNGDYYAGEWERVTRAAKILKDSPLYVEQLPDFSLQDIENTIKRNIREHGILYVFLDYIHTSMKILEEITRRSGGVRLREDNILFMMAIRLKDICVQYDVFIMSATQLNGDYTDTDNYDQNLLRGAKAIADKIDAGMIMLETTANDIESLKTIINSGLPVPTVKISVYKNRRGRWKNIWLWCVEDRGTCKITPVFVTKMNYELVEIQDTQIKFKEK